MLWRRELCRAWMATALAGMSCACALAGQSELERENLTRVAAPAAQIQGVLQGNAGLLVELKRWVAKEAADNGQIAEEADLADQAIYDRLARDVQFRSVATTLLQRYGYLIATPNPESDMAKEQNLVLKERARKMVQIEAQEDSESLRKRAGTEGERTASCDPHIEDCQARPAQKLRSTQTIQTAGMGQGAELTDGLSAKNVSLGLQSSSQKRAPEGVMDGLSGMGAPSALPGIMESSAGIAVAPQPVVLPSSQPGKERGPLFAEQYGPSAMERKANPYADVPSLYDMYVQAAIRQRPPARFGMDMFQNGTRQPDAIPMDLPVGPDYVVGPGDGLAIDLWGGVSQRLVRVVDREGRVSLPETAPLLVSGRTLGEVQQAVQRVLRTQFRDVSADVSLSRLRTVRVYVVGDVAEPGAYDISSLSTPLNALFTAGGVTPRGSLRALKHYRGKELVEEVDAYDLLLHGVRSSLQHLENGDSLMVPPIGPQVTVDGMVRRPAVYELRGEKTLESVLDLAGGILPTAALGHIEVQRIEAHQKRTMLSLSISPTENAESIAKQLGAFEIRDGDEVHIFPIAAHNEDAIFLQGHVLRPGRYSYQKDMKLTDLIASYSDLLPEPAGHYAEIIRLNPPDNRPSVENFDLDAALAKPASAPKLQPLDTVRIFSRYDFEDPPAVWVGGEVRAPGSYRTSGEAHVRDAIYLAGGVAPEASLDSAQLFRSLPGGTMKIFSVNLGQALAGDPLDNVVLQPRDRILVYRNVKRVDPASVSIRGEVAKPGRYPLAENMRLSDLIRSAGGMKRSAAPDAADLTRYALAEKEKDRAAGEHKAVNVAAALAGDAERDLPLHDGDVLTIPQISGWNDLGATISMRGEVKNPGVYGIRPGERLSSVLERAGGFMPTAYPEAVLFERAEVAQLQEKARQELIQRLEREAINTKTSVTAAAGEQAAMQQAAFQQRERALEGVRRAPVTGRLVVNLSGNLRAFAKSPGDIEVRAGDTIEIPKRPGFILVVGQVYNSNAITYQPRKNAEWFLRRAGGPTNMADRGNIFIVRANGSVESGGSKLWGGGVLSRPVGPGDTIVVPEKAIGGGVVWKSLLAMAQIAQGGALTALLATR
jgi:polysaccharide export outer membrane protein